MDNVRARDESVEATRHARRRDADGGAGHREVFPGTAIEVAQIAMPRDVDDAEVAEEIVHIAKASIPARNGTQPVRRRGTRAQ